MNLNDIRRNLTYEEIQLIIDCLDEYKSKILDNYYFCTLDCYKNKCLKKTVKIDELSKEFKNILRIY